MEANNFMKPKYVPYKKRPRKKSKVSKLTGKPKTILSKEKKKCWTAFSIYIRSSAADKDGIAECVTCGVRKPWKKLQAGHFVPGRGNAILFDERGVHPQCFACNVYKKGNPRSYDRYMRMTYGNQVVDEIDELSTTTRKYTIEELQKLTAYYQNKV